MTVVDVNTGKFTGSGGNLEETVTKNNLEAAEEIVRQLRLRDIGGIIVVDFIDMVLESNRDLVLRRLVECLGRDRTRHQVAEVTSLGLVQMTRKRIGTGLLEAFSENCEHCQGRGLVVHDTPVEPKRADDDAGRGRRRPAQPRRPRPRRRQRRTATATATATAAKAPSPKDVAAMARPPADEPDDERRRRAAEPTRRSTTGRRTRPTTPSRPTPSRARALERRRDPRRPSRRRRAETPSASPTPSREPEPSPSPSRSPSREPRRSPPQPEKPKVVTRTRRRSASRPAGPPGHGRAGGDAGRRPAAEPGVVERGAEPAEPGRRAGAAHRARRARPDQEEGLAQALSGRSVLPWPRRIRTIDPRCALGVPVSVRHPACAPGVTCRRPECEIDEGDRGVRDRARRRQAAEGCRRRRHRDRQGRDRRRRDADPARRAASSTARTSPPTRARQGRR